MIDTSHTTLSPLPQPIGNFDIVLTVWHGFVAELKFQMEWICLDL